MEFQRLEYNIEMDEMQSVQCSVQIVDASVDIVHRPPWSPLIQSTFRLFCKHYIFGFSKIAAVHCLHTNDTFHIQFDALADTLL